MLFQLLIQIENPSHLAILRSSSSPYTPSRAKKESEQYICLNPMDARSSKNFELSTCTWPFQIPLKKAPSKHPLKNLL